MSLATSLDAAEIIGAFRRETREGAAMLTGSSRSAAREGENKVSTHGNVLKPHIGKEINGVTVTLAEPRSVQA